jgi:hypothetical protein
MHCSICQCCGLSMRGRVSADNPNVCVDCALAFDQEDFGETRPETFVILGVPDGSEFMRRSHESSQIPSELPRLIEIEPTVVECTDAEADARKAIAEIDRQEQNAKRSSSSEHKSSKTDEISTETPEAHVPL